MTDRHAGYVVTLDEAIREDDAEVILSALRMVKGVLSVTPVVDSPKIHIAQEKARGEFREQVYELARSLR